MRADRNLPAGRVRCEAVTTARGEEPHQCPYAAAPEAKRLGAPPLCGRHLEAASRRDVPLASGGSFRFGAGQA